MPDAERPRMADRDVERVERLSRERASAAVGDGHRDHQRQLDAARLELVEHGGDRRLGVQRVEDGLEQQQIDAAVDAARGPARGTRRAPARMSSARNAGLLTSGEIESVRLVGPIAPATKRGRSGVCAVPLVGGLPSQARALDVQLVRERLEAEVRLRDRGAAKVFVSMMSAPASR